MERAYDIGKKAGLKFVYIGNVAGHKSESTVCYYCSKTAVERLGYQSNLVGLEDSRCQFCKTELNIMTSISKRVK
jgi:pyruvate formate lyase activating enzyme